MPTKLHRVAVSMPEDLDQLLIDEAKKKRLPVATLVVQIIDAYFNERDPK